jgi:two-component sensor histidine kinase
MMVVALLLTLSQLVYTRFHDELRLKIHENELLVQELHHRTKNNLALVASIVALEGGQLKDGAAKLAFESVEGRVLALSTLYERLQRGSGGAEIDLGEYVRDIARGLASSIGGEGVVIESEGIIDGAVAPLSAAIPLGLITNELITNALKHAFPFGKGRIALRLSRSGEGLSLCVEDNGIGKKALAGETGAGQGLGSAIMESLVRQLGGSLAFGRSEDGGTRAELRAPIRFS